MHIKFKFKNLSILTKQVIDYKWEQDDSMCCDYRQKEAPTNN